MLANGAIAVQAAASTIRAMAAVLSFGDNSVALSKPVMSLGRDKNCDIPIADNVASQRHVELRRRADGTWDLVDLGSVNGTRVNGPVSGTITLRDGDAISIGGTLIVYLAAGTVHADADNATEAGPGVIPAAPGIGPTAAANCSAAAHQRSGQHAERAARADNSLAQLLTMAGTSISSYQLERVIGKGAMGVVYEAKQIKLDRRVAFKVMAMPTGPDADQLAEIMLTEARLAGSFNIQVSLACTNAASAIMSFGTAWNWSVDLTCKI